MRLINPYSKPVPLKVWAAITAAHHRLDTHLFLVLYIHRQLLGARRILADQRPGRC